MNTFYIITAGVSSSNGFWRQW